MSNIEQALEESKEEFKKQFDPTSDTYHKGDPRVVKVNDATVPESLRTNQIEWSEAPQEQPQDFGPEYTRVEKMRNDIGELKKAITAVMPPIESITRLKVKLATSPENQKEKVQAQIDQDIKARDAAIENLQKFLELDFIKDGGEYAAKQAVIKDICEKSRQDFVNADELFEFGSKTKQEGQKLFAEQKVLLQRLKDIKKQK